MPVRGVDCSTEIANDTHANLQGTAPFSGNCVDLIATVVENGLQVDHD